MRPASSNSSSTAMTAAGENWQRRTTSSTAVGEMLNKSITCIRALSRSTGASAGSSHPAGVSAAPGIVPRANNGLRLSPSRCGWSGRFSSTSAAVSVRWAPCRIRSWAPRERGSSGEPGTANNSRPASCASLAVIRLPERSAASTITTPRERPAMIRLRRGKCRAWGVVPSGASLTTAPASAMRRWRSACSGG